jgi:hypothetical protein
MSSKSETGHSVNIANFKLITDRCMEFGAIYNPPNPDITIANMSTKWNEVSVLHSSYLVKLEDTKLPINEREILFDSLDRTVVRTLNIYESTKASKQAKKDAKGLVNKITGFNNRIPRLENNLPDPNWVSNSQRSYVKKVDNFEQLIYLYKTDSHYTPNETVLTIASLESMLAALKNANTDVDRVNTIAIKYRTDRNHGLYDINSGVIDISLACKKYVRGLFGTKSPEARSVTGIYLKRVMKIKPV